MEPQPQSYNLCRVWLLAIASLVYCRLVSSRLPAGKWRLLSLLPVFYLFIILPLHTTSAFFTAVVALFLTWLANFRLLLFAFGRGPLVSPAPSNSLLIFIATAALPLTIRPPIEDAACRSRSKTVPLYLSTEIPISAVLISILYDYRERLHPQIVVLAYCCLVFLLIEILIELTSLLVRAFLGLDFQPASDEPYLATSLRDFWGRRWNLTVTNLLRQTVYKPVRAAASPLLGGDCAALPAVLATFLVSGLMHELIFWYVSPATRPSWEMTMFFVVQGVGVVVEFGLATALGGKKRWRMPWWVSGTLTLGFVVGTSFWLFFPPLMRSGADVRVIEECRYGGMVVKGKMEILWEHLSRQYLIRTNK